MQRILDSIKKFTKVEKMKEVVVMSERVGLNVRGSFILGLPSETFSDSLKTIWFSLSLPLDRLKFGLATPYLGTQLWETTKQEEQIKGPEDWDRFSQMAGFTKYRPL